MKDQSLDCMASSSRAARSSAACGAPWVATAATVRSSAARASKASSATAGASQVVKSLSLPQVEGASGRAAGSASSTPSDTVTSRTPCASASSNTARSQSSPSYHQWPSSSVSSAQQSRPPSASFSAARAHEVARVRARELERGVVVVRLAGVVPRLQVVDGPAPVVAVGAVRGVAALVAPDELDRLPVDRHAPRAPRRWRPGVRWSNPATPRLVDAEDAHAVVGQLALETRDVGALGQPEAAAPVAEPAQVRRGAGGHLEPHAGVGGHQRQQPVGGGGGPELHAARARAKAPSRSRPALLEGLVGARVVGGGAAHLGREHGLAGVVQPGRVLGVDRRADVAQEAEVALAGLAAHRLELVAQDGREPERDGRAVEHVEQRQVHARDGLPQPLLAERPGAEALHVGHVRVEDDRERAVLRRRVKA